MEKQRLDVAMAGKKLAKSRAQAREMILRGEVQINGEAATKAGQLISSCDIIQVDSAIVHYQSRGGWKLEKALQEFSISVTGLCCLDVGASTGGFTDCLLRHGANQVYAVDVGHGQLAADLCADSRVVNLEGCNFRYATKKEIPEPIQFAAADVSFISLSIILPALCQFLDIQAQAVCLVKPQFEAGRENIGKKGVVKDFNVHQKVLQQVMQTAMDVGFICQGLTHSPIRGPEGNIEYLLLLQRNAKQDRPLPDIAKVVAAARAAL